jgi:hypothetical protein
MASPIGGTAEDNRVVDPEHNLTPEQKQAKADEADKVALLSVLGQLRAKQKAVDLAKAPFDAAKKDLTETFRNAKAAGFLRYELEELLKDTSDEETTRTLTDKEMRRARLREFCGLPVGDKGVQEKLALLPTMERDRDYWSREGYRRGLAGLDHVPTDGMPMEFHNAHMEEWHRGQGERIAENIRPPAPADPTPEPEPTIADEKLAEQRQINATKAALENMKGGEETVEGGGAAPPVIVPDEPAPVV